MPSRRSRQVSCTLLLAALAGCGDKPGAADHPVQAISHDPYVNPDTWHATQVEPDSFAHGSTIVAAFQSGRAPNGGASNIGWARSADNGVTWTHGFLPGITTVAGGPYARVTDSAVAYDELHGVWMVSYIAFNVPGGFVGPPAAVMVSRSTDDGLTWGMPIAMDIQTTPTIADKNWTVCDNHPTSPFYGRCYTQYSAPSPTPDGYPLSMVVRTSTDGGLTWGEQTGVAGGQYGGGGQPIVQPDGTVVVPFEQLSLTDPNFQAMAAFRSTDGGAAWGDTSEIGRVHLFDRPEHDIRGGVLPSAAVDDAGRIYVVWNDCRFEQGCHTQDVVMTTSDDGIHWTPIRRVPFQRVGSSKAYYLPVIDVRPGTTDSGAHLGLYSWVLQRADCPTDLCKVRVEFLESRDGGNSWSDVRHIGPPMGLTWFPRTGPGYMFGDYQALNFTGDGTAVAVLPIAHKPSDGMQNVPMSVARLVTAGTE